MTIRASIITAIELITTIVTKQLGALTIQLGFGLAT